MLTGIIIILTLILWLIIWILFAPLYINISTRNDEYQVGLSGLFRIYLDKDQGFAPYFKSPIATFPIKSKTRKKTRKSKPKKRTKRSTDVPGLIKLTRAVLGSFRIKRFEVEIDSGDCITNAYLIALLSPIGGFRINDQGKNNLALTIRNRPIRIAWPIVRYWIKF